MPPSGATGPNSPSAGKKKPPFGFILGEVVRRVSGQPIDIYLLDNFFKPMGLKSTWMRIPRSELRNTPRLIALSPSMRGVAFLFNQPIIRSALIPAAGLHSNARELAIFFQMLLNGGEDQGRRYLKPETIALAAQSHYEGYDQFIKAGMNWGLGLIMGGGTHLDPDPRLRVGGYGGSTATFAALGMGTCMVWADRREKLVVAFTANAMLGDTETAQRWADISNAVWDCLPAE